MKLRGGKRAYVAGIVVLQGFWIAAALADCPGVWIPGSGLEGQPTTINASTVWDPDGAAGLLAPRLVVGGAINSAGGVGTPGVAAGDGASWSAIGRGLSGNVLSLTTWNNKLVVGGQFLVVDNYAQTTALAFYDGIQFRYRSDCNGAGRSDGVCGDVPELRFDAHGGCQRRRAVRQF